MIRCSLLLAPHLPKPLTKTSAPTHPSPTTRLTTELPNHEVHISYVVSFAGVPDSYRVYTDAGLLPFAEIPYSDRDYAPLSEAEQRRALNAAIHQAVGGVGASDAAIHIVYASVVSMGEGEGWSLSSRKYLHFGSGVSRLDQMKVRQIVPAPELEIAAPVSQNDTYLAAYVDELIAALKDPDYVVTGMIRYKGELYADGDTIYYFPTSNQTIANPMAGREWLELLINPRYPAAWTDWQEVGTSPALIEEKTATDAFLRLQPEHFQGVHTLQARYDEKIATVCFYPINLQVYPPLAPHLPPTPPRWHNIFPKNARAGLRPNAPCRPVFYVVFQASRRKS